MNENIKHKHPIWKFPPEMDISKEDPDVTIPRVED